jgi:hypothetical protein
LHILIFNKTYFLGKCYAGFVLYRHLFRVVAVIYPQKLPAPLYKSLGLLMRPATADAAATAGLAR